MADDANHVCTIACAIPSFEECAAEALSSREFVEQWNRLRPEHRITVMATMNRSPIARMVDEACKVPPVIWSEETKHEFFTFFRDYIWRPVAMRIMAELQQEPSHV